MKQIKIEYIDSMGSDLSAVNAARVSFDKESHWKEYEEGELLEKDAKLIKYLADHKHMTPFRHNQIQLRCHAPIFIARQLGKHQAGLSWNEISRRYVDSEPEFYMPDYMRARPLASIKQGSTINEVINNRHMMSVLSSANKAAQDAYKELIEGGVAPEMARMVLPQSMMTSWYWTGNLLAFAHVYKERINEGAQLEAQHFAKELDKIIRPLFPVSWKALVG